MKKTTLKGKTGTQLSERWRTYAGMSAAFMAVGGQADGQVVYTDVDPDEVLVNGTYGIDFDGDGDMDLVLQHTDNISWGNGGRITFNGSAMGTGSGSSYFYASVLAGGAQIGPSSPNWNSPGYPFGSLVYFVQYTYSGSIYNYTYGNWLGQTGFLGVRFTSGGGTNHYAWVHLSVGNQAEKLIILGYAYQATPNLAITAGDVGSVGLSDAVAAALDASIFPNPATQTATLQLDAVKAGVYQVSILNGMGQVLSSQQVNAGTGTHRFDLDLSSLAAGTYFVEVRGEDQVVMRKLTKEG